MKKSIITNDKETIKKIFDNYKNNLKNINDNNLNIWSGLSRDNAYKVALEFINEYEGPVLQQYEDLSNICDLYMTYEDTKKQIVNYNKLINETELDVTKLAYTNILNEKNNNLNNLKNQIQQLIDDIISKKIASNICNINANELLESLNGLPILGRKNLKEFYEENYINNYIKEIEDNYKGREKSVNIALAYIKLAADKNYKLSYVFGGGHNKDVLSTDDILNGVDCSSFASYIVNEGSTRKFAVTDTWTLESRLSNKQEKFSDAEPGDLLIRNKGNSGHVVVVVENNKEKEEFIVAEAKATKSGIVLSKKNYKSYGDDAYKAFSLEDWYEK